MIEALLTAVIALLMKIQEPQIPQETRDVAIELATQVLEYVATHPEEIKETIVETPSVPVQIPQTPVVETPVYHIEIKVAKNEVAGANCDTARYEVYVLDQNGNKPDVQITMTAPHDTQVAKNPAVFEYTTPAKNTIEHVSFKSGDLFAVSALNVRNGLDNARIQEQDGKFFESTSGKAVNKDTMTCV